MDVTLLDEHLEPIFEFQTNQTMAQAIARCEQKGFWHKEIAGALFIQRKK